MSNLATLEKARPEEMLARLQTRNPHYLPDLLSRIKVSEDLSFGRFSPPERIRQALDRNRENLEALPSDNDVEQLVQAVRKALSVCSEKNIRRQVAQLIGSFPNANPTDPETYIAALVFDLLDSQIPDAILILTCQELRRTCRFVPAIAEVIDTANRHLEQWQQVLTIPDTLSRVRQRLTYAVQTTEKALQESRSDDGKPKPPLPPSATPSPPRSISIHYPSLQREFAADQAMLEAIAALDANEQCAASVALVRYGRQAAEALIRNKQEARP